MKWNFKGSRCPRRIQGTGVVTAGVVALVLVTSVPGFAQDAPSAPRPNSSYEELTRRAEDAFRTGDHEGALEDLHAAYELRKHPNTLYNIARVYEDHGDLATAIEYYDRFLVSGGVSLTNRREALDRRKTLNEILLAQSKAAPRESLPTVEQNARAVEAPRVAPARDDTRTLGVVVTSVGAAALAGGGLFGVLALTEQNEFQTTNDLENARSAARRARTFSRVADVLVVSGAALGVTGLVLWLRSPSGSESGAQALGIDVGRDGLGASWTLKF